jgi:hemin uptake protein HemP
MNANANHSYLLEITTMTTQHATPPAATLSYAKSPPPALHPAAAVTAPSAVVPVKRISSASLMDGRREVEIEHGGKIYRLRVTQLNKLILTA